MSMTEWAENEVRIACKRENPDWDGKSFDYGCTCYQSALKAYKSLMGDEHSGFSFGVTKVILKRLLDELPITPIEDVPENWNMINDGSKDGCAEYQCVRMSGLFKHVEKDGKVWYSDNNRVVCVDAYDTSNRFHSGVVNRIINEMFPVLMPYYPSKAPAYIVHTVDISKDGTIYGMGVLEVDCPDGEKVNIGRYFDYTGDKDVEIAYEDFIRLKEKYS